MIMSDGSVARPAPYSLQASTQKVLGLHNERGLWLLNERLPVLNTLLEHLNLYISGVKQSAKEELNSPFRAVKEKMSETEIHYIGNRFLNV